MFDAGLSRTFNIISYDVAGPPLLCPYHNTELLLAVVGALRFCTFYFYLGQNKKVEGYAAPTIVLLYPFVALHAIHIQIKCPVYKINLSFVLAFGPRMYRAR